MHISESNYTSRGQVSKIDSLLAGNSVILIFGDKSFTSIYGIELWTA